MKKYVITTDNNADLPESYYREHGVGCMYLSYTIDGVHYTHENFMDEPEFYEKMRTGSMPTTAQVNPEEAKELFEPYLKEEKDILHIAFSSGLSGTCNSASLGQGLLVYLAQKKKEEGQGLDAVAEWAEQHKQNIVHLFTVDDLNHLYRGGRVSKMTAVLGGMLNIKPILHVDEEGKLIPIGKVRGRKKSLLELADLMDKKIGSCASSCDTVFISHGDCLEEAQFLSRKIKEKYQVKTEIINYVGAVIGAHSGPGTMALFFVGDER